MEIRFDWPKIYQSVLFERPTGEKFAQLVARRIERAIDEDGTPQGECLGTSPDLCERFGIGKETLLEATRLLEDRGIARMRRGARGGLIALGQVAPDPAALLTRYLRGAGMSINRIVEARRVIELLQIHDHHVRHGRTAEFEGLFRRLVLDRGAKFGEPFPTGPWTGAKPHPCLKPFLVALEALLVAEEAPKECDSPRFQGLVGLSAEFLANEVARLRSLGIEKLGSEQQLAERIGVSRQVLRQAMRLLEDQGLLTCRRGRSNGIVTAAAHPGTIVRDLSDAFARQGLAERDFRHILGMLDRTNRSLFATKADAGRFDALRQTIEYKEWQNPVTHIRRMHVEWPVLNNPALSLLEQTLSAYRARRAGPKVFVALSDITVLRQKMAEHVDLMSQRNIVGADRHYMEMHGHIAVLLGGH